ncbi:glycosyltransferase [Pedobacter sp. P351]|uniref:glycosyltransferase family 4 protein n=1 Tax=Pedobacter superstes TaxID=3133441 RepID=UPI0030996520
MNILIFSTVFFPAIGGIESQTLLLAKEFVKKGHAVKVITEQKQVEKITDLEVYCRPGLMKSVELFLWCSTFYMPNISLKGAWLLLFNPSKTWVISHNDFSSCDKKGLIPGLKNIANKFASKNIAVSKSIAQYLGPSSAVVHNGYDDSVFKLYPEEERTFDFVFLGRLVSQKGCELLIRACASLKQPFTLNIIGSGPEEQSLKALSEKLGLSNSITFSGILTGEELARCLNRYRVMVVPSLLGEGFGMVVLEGLACGCKIIAANAAGLAEAVGSHGRKFPMGDQKELTKLLEDSLLSKENLASGDKSLQNHLKEHSKSVVSEYYLKYFK